MRLNVFLLIFSGLYAGVTHAAAGVGVLAHNMMEPVTVLSSFLNSAALIIGITCLFAAIIRYTEYRRNPLANPISSVIVLFLVGVILVLLPFVYKLTTSGIPYHLFN